MKLDSLKVFSLALLFSGAAQVASAQTGIDPSSFVNISEIKEGVTDINQAVHGQPNNDEYKDGEVGCVSSECGNNPVETFHEGISDIVGAVTVINIGNCVGGPPATSPQPGPMSLNLGGVANNQLGGVSNLLRSHTPH